MNDPAQVAGAFRALLTDGGRFAGHFEQVVFGILDRSRQRTRNAFARTFGRERRRRDVEPEEWRPTVTVTLSRGVSPP